MVIQYNKDVKFYEAVQGNVRGYASTIWDAIADCVRQLQIKK